MTTLFIIDIDGTIAHAGKRFSEAGPEPSREDKAVYDVWVRNVQNAKSLREDLAVPGMVEMTQALSNSDNHVVYLTSREEKWRDVTESWLGFKGFPSLPLIMRPDDDYRDSADYKEDSIEFLSRLYKSRNVVVLDDDEHGNIEKRCHENKWTFLRARSGGQK